MLTDQGLCSSPAGAATTTTEQVQIPVIKTIHDVDNGQVRCQGKNERPTVQLRDSSTHQLRHSCCIERQSEDTAPHLSCCSHVVQLSSVRVTESHTASFPCIRPQILGFGADLAEGHPGFHDQDYKRRRAMLAEQAKLHQMSVCRVCSVRARRSLSTYPPHRTAPTCLKSTSSGTSDLQRLITAQHARQLSGNALNNDDRTWQHPFWSPSPSWCWALFRKFLLP